MKKYKALKYRYYTGFFLSFLGITIILVGSYIDYSQEDLQANLVLQSTNISEETKIQNKKTEQLIKSYTAAKLINQSKIHNVTRYLDQLEQSFKKGVFQISSLSYSDSTDYYTTANLMINTDRKNLFNLLDIITESNLTSSKSPYVLEVLDLNIDIPAPENKHFTTLKLRIYPK